MFSYEFCEISKNAFLTEHLQATSGKLLYERKYSGMYYYWNLWENRSKFNCKKHSQFSHKDLSSRTYLRATTHVLELEKKNGASPTNLGEPSRTWIYIQRKIEVWMCYKLVHCNETFLRRILSSIYIEFLRLICQVADVCFPFFEETAMM